MKLRSLFCVLGAVSVGVLTARAQFVWTDADLTDSFSDGLNWLPTITPTNGSTLLFGVAGTPNVILDENFTASTITFDTFAYDITHFSGTLTITSGIVYTALDTGTTFINVPISISSVISILNTSITGALELEGVGGTGGITLTGVGHTLLGGINTYGGATLVSSGTLADAGVNAFSPNSLYDVVSGGHLIVNDNETVSGLSDNAVAGGTVAVASGAVLIMNGTTTTRFSGVISGLGGIEKDGLGTLTLTGTNTYTGSTVVGTGAAIDLGGGTSSGSILTGVSGAGSLSFDRTNPVTFTGALSGALNVVQAGNATTTLTGNNSYSGSTSVIQGILQAGSLTAFGGAGDSAVSVGVGTTLDLNGFSNTVGSISGAGTLTLAGVTLTLANTAASTNFTGTISGAGGSLQTGEFALELLGNNNTYSGGTTITAGSLVADNPTGSSATGTGAITIDPGAALVIGQSNLSGNISPGAAITNNGDIAFFRTDVAGFTFANQISGTGAVDQDGTGITRLTGTNTYSGITTILNGTLQAGSLSAFGGAVGLSPVSFSAFGTLDLNGFSNTIGSLNGAGASFITLGSGTLTIGDPAGNGNYAGTISGGGGAMVFGGNSMILTGSNTYTGGTTVTHGSLLVANTAGSGTGSGAIALSPGATLDIGAGSTAGSVGAAAITDDGMINFNRSDIPTFSSSISGTGAVTLNGGGVVLTGTNAYSGGTTINAGTFSVGNGATVGARITGNIFDATALVFAPAVADNYTYAGGISGAGTVTFAGPGSITLSGVNTYLGITSVDGGTLADAGMGAFSASSRMLVNSSGGSLAVNFNETVADLENGGTGGPVSIAGGAILTSLGAVYGGDFQGAVSGGGKFSVSAGVQGLSGNNAYTGGTLITGIGELFVGSNTALGTGTLTLNGTSTDLSPDANVSLANAVVLNSTLDNTAGGTNDLTLTGPITGAAGITWSAPGTLTLTNAGNTFGGNIDMVDGNLVVGSSGATGAGTIVLNSATSITVSGVATVNNPLSFPGTAAVVAGNGTIATPVTVNAGVILAPSAAPGGGPGNLSFTNGLTLATNGTIHFDLFDATGAAGTGYSLITSSAGLTVAATANSITFDLISTNAVGAPANAINFIPTTFQSWTIATSSGLSGFSGNEFHIDTTRFSNGLAGGAFSITGSSTDLTLNFTPVPEPATWAMLGAGLLAIVPFVVRRKRVTTA